MTVLRPLWRSFTQRFIANAATHVRAGGHAMVWRPGTGKKPVAWMLLPTDASGDLTELGFWSALALERNTYERLKSGPAKGLATLRIPRDFEHAVESWCERDSRWPGSTRAVQLDCLTCASCCKRNRVQLDDDDFARWHEADRDDLSQKPYTRTEKGITLVQLKKSGDCVHLDGVYCGIYALRPDNCRLFPVGSEPCLGARKEELGVEE